MPPTHKRKTKASGSRTPKARRVKGGGTVETVGPVSDERRPPVVGIGASAGGLEAFASGVTSFFRDSPAFDELATKVLAPLVRERDQDTPIRIWVPGCSTGEEAYSIAIALAEQIAAAKTDCRVQIFATDVDHNALEIARSGTYPESIALDVSPSRLQRFFTRDGHRYKIRKSIRESVVFAVQNLTSDPPFARLDVVSCRNVLIPLEREMQEKLLSVFHFALNPGGSLFGTVPGGGRLDELFTPISKRCWIFRRVGGGRRPPFEMPLPALAVKPTLAAELAEAVRRNRQLVLETRNLIETAQRDRRVAREQVAEDLRRMTRLHELGAQVLAAVDLRSMLEQVIRAALDITAAQKGTVQLCDDTGVLTIAAHTGFDRPFLDFFARVGADAHSPCAAAATTRQRVLVEDVTTSPIFAGHPSLAVMTEAGARAVQSTPLFDRSGHFLGMFSTHYRDVHHFDQAELRWLDLLARHAVDAMEWQRAEELLARAHQELEARVADRTRWLSLMHDVASEINAAATWDEALHRMLRLLCQTEHWQIDVRLEGEPPEALHDGKIATELYRIAQEAVTNSVKHGQANTVTIGLTGRRDLTQLTIADDGIGIPRPEPGDGAGLRIMRYRATSIGASLSVERGATGGTVVTCTLRQPPTSGTAQA